MVPAAGAAACSSDPRIPRRSPVTVPAFVSQPGNYHYGGFIAEPLGRVALIDVITELAWADCGLYCVEGAQKADRSRGAGEGG